ncbi:MAG: DUF4139 domain-containing protein [Planctomycetota bacterium]|nr:MAG: DUF4139 domain-containing protein [Planctomycetota bacterium]
MGGILRFSPRHGTHDGSATMLTTMLRRCNGSLVALCCVGLLALPAAAQEKKANADENGVPLSKVVMFTSGVGYFEHRGSVDGDATVEMRFNSEDINDLLKSMVLEDRGGGKISTVTYGSRDPITKTLKTFPIDLTNNPTLGDILNQVRGERVHVVAPSAVTGVLLGVEKRRKEVGGDHEPVMAEHLNLLTDEGLRSVPMESVSRIQLLNEELDKEFHKALMVLASGHNNDKKSVTLQFLGQGKRPVRVGYIQETPVWKTSYRLVLDEKEAPFLQGWAIVENTSEEDWENVQLTLVSGRPISYRMDLYEPLYAQRPLEQLELYASLRPQVYGDDLAQQGERFEALSRARAAGRLASGKGVAGGAAPEAAPPAAAEADAFSNNMSLVIPVDKAATTSAEAAQVGELFQYVIGTPVTLERQKSAMLPIVNESVEAEKLAIYNPAVQARHPLNGLRLVNSTDLHLMQGPITVFDGATYAGDAKIEDLAPGAERLISYALDLNTEVAPETKSGPEQLVNVKLRKGTMQITRKYVRDTTYTVKNSNDETKTVLIERPFDANWKLVAPKEPTEKTRNMYRFAVQAEPGKPAKLEVAEEQIVHQSLALTNLDDSTIAFYVNQKQVTPEVKKALEEIVKRKRTLAEVAEQRKQLEKQIASISSEQSRIRDNMARLDRDSDLYRRYILKFTEQEDAIDKMRVEIEDLTEKEAELRKALDDYLLGLDV